VALELHREGLAGHVRSAGFQYQMSASIDRNELVSDDILKDDISVVVYFAVIWSDKPCNGMEFSCKMDRPREWCDCCHPFLSILPEAFDWMPRLDVSGLFSLRSDIGTRYFSPLLSSEV
jgi:hypothetical protein